MVYGQMFDFTPTTFILPNEYKKFIEEVRALNPYTVIVCKVRWETNMDLQAGRSEQRKGHFSYKRYWRACV